MQISRPRDDDRCGDCRFWHHYDNGRIHTRVGLCKRMPPTAIPFADPHPDDDRNRRGKALWPVMVEGEFCHEFKPTE
mgnify:CR=1 FL=1